MYRQYSPRQNSSGENILRCQLKSIAELVPSRHLSREIYSNSWGNARKEECGLQELQVGEAGSGDGDEVQELGTYCSVAWIRSIK